MKVRIVIELKNSEVIRLWKELDRLRQTGDLDDYPTVQKLIELLDKARD